MYNIYYMQQNITKRLSRDTTYKKDTESYQSKLTDKEIAKKLEDYIKVEPEDVTKISLGTHIRYFTVNPKTGETQFRLGGTLTKCDEKNKYIVCSNGTFSWSVQLSNAIIYKKLSTNELKEYISVTDNEKIIEKDKIIEKKVDKIKKIQDKMEELENENKELKTMLKKIKQTTIDAKNKKK